MKTLPPGIHEGVPEDVYHGLPYLSAGLAWDLVKPGSCPAKAFVNSAFDPARERVQKRAFDFGTAAHLLMLEADRLETRTQVIDADDYRMKEARDAREAAYDAALVPLLRREFEALRPMRDALHADPVAGKAFRRGRAEVTVIWDDPEHGFRCKARVDYLRPRMAIDYKTAESADPATFGRRGWDLGYHARAAWYVDGLRVATGGVDHEYFFVCQEKVRPFLCVAGPFAEQDVWRGRTLMARARRLFATIQRTDVWPGYATGPVTFDAPAWARRQHDEAPTEQFVNGAHQTASDAQAPIGEAA